MPKATLHRYFTPFSMIGVKEQFGRQSTPISACSNNPPILQDQVNTTYPYPLP